MAIRIFSNIILCIISYFSKYCVSDPLCSSVEDMTLLPPSGFSDSRELSDVECDRDRDRDRERDWQDLSTGTRHGGSLGRLPIEAVESMLARYRHEPP